MTYYNNWYKHFIKEHPKPINFWDFLCSVRESNVPSGHAQLQRMYQTYFKYHPTEYFRLSPELQLHLEEKPHGYCRQGGMIGAEQRIYLSFYAMLSSDVTDSDFKSFWDSLIEMPNNLMRIPEDNKLDSRHILERVHILLCYMYDKFRQLIDN